MGSAEHRRIGRSAWWPIPTAQDRPTQAQPADSDGAQPAAPGPLGIPIGCRITHGLRYYADQPIPWPNSRKGVKWHDGQPFSADDVKASFDRILSKDFQSPKCGASLKPMVAAVDNTFIKAWISP